jgi:predicted ATPase
MVNLVEHLVSQGDIATLPEALKQTVEKHTERLSRDERRLLEAACMLGSQFESRVLAAAINADALQVEECCAALARRSQFLRANSGCYGFIHELYRRALYQGLTPARRMRLHLQLNVTPLSNITAIVTSVIRLRVSHKTILNL